MRVVVGMGANLGERLETLREARARIARRATVLASSQLWETAPVGGPAQPDYLNAAVLLEWTGSPIELLDALMEIERELGRVREVVNGPRTIDLDVLWIDGEIVSLPRLVVPHPRLHERAFAIAPLLDLVPDAVDPRTNERYAMPISPHAHAIRPLNRRL